MNALILIKTVRARVPSRKGDISIPKSHKSFRVTPHRTVNRWIAAIEMPPRRSSRGRAGSEDPPERPVDDDATKERRNDAEDDAAGVTESMTIEETNAMRAKLGMAPLREGKKSTIVDAGRALREAAEAEKTAALAEKVARARAKREAERVNARTKKLGDDDDDDDGNVGAWLAKSKGKMASKAQEMERAKAAKMAAMFAERDEDAEEASDEDEEEEKKKRGSTSYTSKDLRGLKVRHTADEINEGQEVVLTLKDTSVLDDEDDELENVLIAERKSRKKARREATKKSDDPFGEEDATANKTVLGKYDEKADDDAMELDDQGCMDAAETRRKEEIKARLAAELSGLKGKLENTEVVRGEQADYHTQEEMQAKFVKREKKKKMRKKIRKRTVEHIDAAELEQEALAQAGGASDLGSRRSRAETGSAVEKAAKSKMEDQDAKFASALQKAREVTDKKILAELAGDDDEEEEDDELARALARSRKMANKNTRTASEDVFAQVAARRLADEAKAKEETVSPAEEALVFTDMSEFVQGINTDPVEDEQPEEDLYRGAGEEEMPDVPPPPPGPDAMEEDEMPDVPPPPPGGEEAAAEPSMPVLAEKHVVKKGLASTLALLKEKAQLDDAQNTRWSGRANDMKDRFDKQHVIEANAMEEKAVDGYKFGFKLDKFDEFGRKLTPKEAFRELCHRFHGIEPGKMKREKRLRQFQEEQARLKATSVMDERIKEVQREQASPFVVLSGHVRAGQSKQADPIATAKREQDERTPAPSGFRSTKTPTTTSKATNVSGSSKVSFAMKPTKK